MTTALTRTAQRNRQQSQPVAAPPGARTLRAIAPGADDRMQRDDLPLRGFRDRR